MMLILACLVETVCLCLCVFVYLYAWTTRQASEEEFFNSKNVLFMDETNYPYFTESSGIVSNATKDIVHCFSSLPVL